MSDGNADSARARILFIAMYLVPNDARFLKLRDRLAAEGFEVSAIVPQMPGIKVAPGVTAVQPGPLTRLAYALRPLPGIGTLANAWLARKRKSGLAKAAVRSEPDVIIGFDPEAMPAAIEAKRRTGARFVFDAHEYHSEEDPDHPLRGRWVARLETRLDPHLDGFVTVNQSIADLYVRDARIKRSPLVVRNAVDPYPSHDGVDRLRPALGVPESENILLYHGALRPMRGLIQLAEMSWHLPQGWTIAVMGEGALREEMERAGHPQRLRFLPSVPHAELPLWIASATLGVILYEGRGENQRNATPNKLWEYAAAGVPMLARDLPELAAAIRSAGMGILVSDGEAPADIARRLGDLDPDWLTQASAAARRFAEKNSWSREVEPFVDLVRQLAQTSRG
ncbi:glycosyltransferase family 4 protein [Hyphobacterium marinum]|uniref:Glycosyltransferase family 4 protein n=1 Tax=Hyphobacterium marinum TaxID=3116574 RepID=A0ABU7LY15_9PROT|nr:glycosyltransferase family 4 protein [Hyphobacterium sp. Y6023]MEE2566449.1 glycosyltransferase family 4 protein [Hyphobacterium sp. Y6023]